MKFDEYIDMKRYCEKECTGEECVGCKIGYTLEGFEDQRRSKYADYRGCEEDSENYR